MLKKLLKLLNSFIPRRLPTGLTAFDRWVDAVLEYSGIDNTPKNRQVCAGFILQLPPTLGFISIHKASSMLIKAAANQVSAEVLRSASEEAKPTAVTTKVGPKVS
jgi:hypothetical protein